jgi:hypothetical protein
MIAVSAAHIAYLLYFRPYAARLEQWIAVLLASLQTLVAVSVVAVLVSGLDGGDGHWSMKMLAYSQLAFDAAAMGALLAVALFSLIGDLRKARRSTRRSAHRRAMDGDGNAQPLLQAPVVVAGPTDGGAGRRNPLDDAAAAGDGDDAAAAEVNGRGRGGNGVQRPGMQQAPNTSVHHDRDE